MKLTSRLEFVILFCVFAFTPQNAFAFMSPSTVTLVAAAMNSSIAAILVFAGVNLLLLLRKINRTTKAVFLIMVVSSLIGAGFLFIHRFNAIKKLNDHYVEVPLQVHEIDLNKLSLKELEEYKIVTIDAEATILDVESMKQLSLPERFVIKKIFSDFPSFEKEFDLTLYKDKKLLAICESGGMSSRIAAALREKGYDAFYARLSRTYNAELLNKYFRFKKKPTASLLVVPYSGQPNRLFINFDFKRPPRELEENEIVESPQFLKEMAEGKNIVCSSNFSCLMTKHFLDLHGIKNRKIYQLPDRSPLGKGGGSK